MAFPKRISPDSIREAVVEARYISMLPNELLPGLFFQAFDDKYTYTDRPVRQSVQNPGNNSRGLQEISFQVGRPSIIYNDKISVQFLPQSIVISCLSQYIGWADFQPEIEKALTRIHGTGQIQAWTRVGLRYITEYVEKDLHDISHFVFKFGLPDVKSLSAGFRSEFFFKENKAILNLVNKAPIVADIAGETSKQSHLSRIDIDVMKEDLVLNNVGDVLKVIENLHDCEKEIFFGMLKDEFIKSLNPEY